ncbi:sorting nexin-13-like isoform X4 [Diabrotica undecimpunctata]|uniref:sorting nexin-13-like isoform X4 n=1 Tax=Diabrotica undecimpunctata TaxID=50387 RepID=UPI003B63F823
METNTAGWMGLIVALCFTTFGVSWLLIITISLLLFIIGLASLLHVQRVSIEKFYIKCAGNPLSSSCIKKGGLEQIVKQLESPKKVQKHDSRVTGSELIDSSLQEILGYIIRDYILTWYNLITRDVEFTDTTVRRTAQTLAINISNRVKEIDWIPYLAQKFVDDAASHLKLYKQARAKMKLQEAAKEQKSSPQRDKTSTKKTVHKRNKSETDVSWYSGRSTELKKDQEKVMKHSKFSVSDEKKNISLEDHFFDLEHQMEEDTVSRDLLCRNLDIEKDGQSLDYIQLESIKKIDLTLNQILKNNIALSYFIDFVTIQGKQLELFFYLNVEGNGWPFIYFFMQILLHGWKVSVEQQLSNLHLTKIIKGSTESFGPIYENIRSTALSIYDQYLGEKIEQRVQIKPTLIQALHFKIRNLNETPSETWFDGVLEATYEKMESKHLPLFKKNKSYVKLLQELDLLQQPNSEDDVVSINSNESLEIIDPFPIATKKMEFLTVIDNPKNVKHVRSLSDVTMPVGTNESEIKYFSSGQETTSTNETDAIKEKKKVDQKALTSGDFNITINIIETGIVCEKGKTFGIYAMRVSRSYDTGYQEDWHIYRRYSDFHDLYCKVKEKFPDLSKLSFPGKKTFHNMDRAVLERRMRMLGSYMDELCQTNLIFAHHGLKDLLMTFLEQGDYDKANGGPISTTIDTLVNPLKSGMKTIKSMPEQLINTVDEVVGGLTKVFHPKPDRFPEACKVGASIEETDDNIPLRIMLLLMDEVFDLKSRNQWLRRRIVTLLRQIVRTMFGDIVNRRILEYVSFITSPKNVAQYLYIFKHSFWPNGMRNDRRPERDDLIKSRTRVAAKIALLSCLSDELKHIIGSETTRRGLLTIFDLFQRPILNRRLLYVLLEGILSTLFPEKDMNKLFIKLYSKSKKNEQINIQKSS